jgi:Na+-translocating ferredoxin:NAD+ oxidoreductase RnfE subunit
MRSSRHSWLRKTVGVFFDAFLPKNVVLVQAAGLCPLIAASVKLTYGVALSVCAAAILLPVSLILSAIGPHMPPWMRPMAAVVTGALILTGVALAFSGMFPEIYAVLYVFLPLTAVSTLSTTRAGFSTGSRPSEALADALGASLGFGLVICAVSAFRELAIYNTIWGVSIDMPLAISDAASPFVAFILLGLMAALLQRIRNGAPDAETEGRRLP